ncbi:MAG TPA: GTPase, partial [Casimicrobiaceae bacterium]|nr:GTPase [Casimicrobiaceae bacterium]
SIRLLPIETRLNEATVSEFKNYADEWVTFPLDLAQADRMAETLARVSQVKRVPVALARKYGLFTERDDDILSALERGDEGSVDIPCWRHAEINFPHPLLQQGLIILDTPGLNAIGTEPELTLNLLPNAHAVLFLLAADAGVTKTDLDVWNGHLAGEDEATKAARMVILNKIDGLWDDLKEEVEINAEIDRQVDSSAKMLGISPAQVFAVSAQKALLAKVNGDDALLTRSRLPILEHSLSRKLIPAKRDLVGAATQNEIRAMTASIRSLLDARRAGIGEQLVELIALRGKNQDVVEHMMERVKEEKEIFERGLARYTALRTVFTQHTNDLFDIIGLSALRQNAARTRERIEGSPFTKGVRDAMGDFFARLRADFDQAGRQGAEIHDLMRAMYTRFAHENRTELYVPPQFSVLKYLKEIERMERAYNTHFNTLWNMVSKAKYPLMKQFFETIASRSRHIYKVANRDVEVWLKAVMSPLETQVREHHTQLRRRLDSVRRIHRASDELESRIMELEQTRESIEVQRQGMKQQVASLDMIIEAPEALPLAANG